MQDQKGRFSMNIGTNEYISTNININSNTLGLYHIFLTVAETRNLSQAAKKLYISQPAVSKAIKRLEEELGCTLFIRSSRGVKLTEEGALLHNHVSQALFQISAGENMLRTRKSLGVGRIRFGASNTLCRYLLLPRLKSFVKDNPHVNISIHCQSSSHTLRMVEGDEIDIGLIAAPEYAKGLTLYPAGTIQDTFVASPEYIRNLMLRENSNITECFCHANLMLLTKDNVTRTYVDSYLDPALLSSATLMEIGSMDLLIEFAKTGLGIGCVIREFVENELKEGTLAEISPSGLHIPKREVCYCVNNTAPLSDAALKFLEHYRN